MKKKISKKKDKIISTITILIPALKKVMQLKRNFKIWFSLSENSLEQLISENIIFPHFWNFYANLIIIH